MHNALTQRGTVTSSETERLRFRFAEHNATDDLPTICYDHLQEFPIDNLSFYLEENICVRQETA